MALRASTITELWKNGTLFQKQMIGTIVQVTILFIVQTGIILKHKKKRGCKKIKSILVFAANAVYFKKKRGYIAIFLAFPFGEGVNGVDERGH